MKKELRARQITKIAQYTDAAYSRMKERLGLSLSISELKTCTGYFASVAKYDIAESLLRSLIRIMPGSSYVHSYLGDVLLAVGNDGAEAEFAKAITLDPENLPAVRQYSELVIERVLWASLSMAIGFAKMRTTDGSKFAFSSGA